MITPGNRHSVTNTLQRLLSAAEYYSAFALVSCVSFYDTERELRHWAGVKAEEIDEQFKILATHLGYRVEALPTDNAAVQPAEQRQLEEGTTSTSAVLQTEYPQGAPQGDTGRGQHVLAGSSVSCSSSSESADGRIAHHGGA